MSIPNYLTPAQAAREVGVCESTIYRRIKKGILPAAKVCGKLAVNKDDLLEWHKDYWQAEIERRPSKARAKKKELSPTRARALSLAQQLARRKQNNVK